MAYRLLVSVVTSSLVVTTARRLGLRVGIGIFVDPKTTNFQGSTQHRVLEHVSI